MIGTPTVTATQLLIKWQSSTIYHCPDVIVVEIACNSAPYSGLAQFSYTSGVVTGASTPYTYPTMTINISQLCPGTVYKFRAKEKNNSSTTSSGWTGNFNFTTQGTFIQPTLNVTASPNTICPPQTSQLTANLINGCGGTGITYSWTPSTGLSCITCSNPIASPAVTTTYTVVAKGGQLGCWTASNTVTVFVTTVPPVVGIVSASPPTLCAGGATTLSSTSYTGNIQWQSSTSSSGPFTNIAGATSGTLTTGALPAGTYFYQATVAGCGATLTTNQAQVTVNPGPTVTVNSSSMCAGQSVNLTANGATSYTWSAGANSTGVNTATAAPASTTAYTVTGTSLGCSSSAVSNVTVIPNPVVNIGSNSPVCLGFNINLTSSGGGSYQWTGPNSFSSIQQNPTVAGATTVHAGVYNLTVTTSGCSTSTNVNVSVVTPTASASNSGPYCSGTTVQLNGSAAVSYTWTGPNGFTSNVQSPSIANSTTLATGEYTLQVSLGTCTAMATTSVVVNQTPLVTVNSTSICIGSVATLSAGGGTNYVWSSGANSTAVGTATTSPSSTSSFTVIGTAANGCTASAVSDVTVHAYPVVNIGSNSPVCLGFNLNLTSGGGGTYQWDGPNSFTSVQQNPTIVGTTTANAGVYNLTVTANACSTTTNINVSIVTPTVSAGNTGPYCAGATVQLNGSAATSYTWSGPNAFSSNSQNPSITNSSSSASGTYSLLVSIGTCTAETTTSVVVNALPTPSITSNSPLCEGASLNLQGSGGTQYQWSGPAFNTAIQNPTINPVSMNNAGVYMLTVTDANSCTQSTTVNITVNPLPLVTVTGYTGCIGSTANLNASGGSSYSWTGPNGFSSTAASPTIALTSSSQVGQYVVVVTGANGCTLSTATSVGAFPIPVASAFNSGPVCLNKPVSFSSSGGLIYSWSGPNSFVSSLQNPVISSANSTNYTGTYTVTVIDNKGCAGYATTYLEVRPLPTANLISSNNNLCVPFCSAFSLTASSGSIVSALWSSNNSGNMPGLTYTTCFNQDGKYILTASFTDNFGCSNTGTFEINAYPKPLADFNFGPANPIEQTDVLFSDASVGASINQWNWYFINNAGFTTTQQNPTYIFDQPGGYAVTLIATNKWGCKDTITKAIPVGQDFNFYVPNAFTPNEDGVNDVFMPKGYGLVKYSIRIFDRWGEELFYTTEFGKGWDGTFKGLPCKVDVYAYVILAQDSQGRSREFTGHVSLMR